MHDLRLEEVGTIESVYDAIKIINDLEKDNDFCGGPKFVHPKFPFGLWFRGQSNAEWHLTPTVYRKKPDSNFYDELDVLIHLQLRVPHYRDKCKSTFDWLCFIQHYSLPTRLLDWTESLLFGLYFSVKDSQRIIDEDASLFILNARKLNHYVRGKPTICDPEVFDAIIRSEMATTRSKIRLLSKKSVIDAAAYEDVEEKLNNLETFSTPVAVFPNRLNYRMVFQQSVYTLHGGKKYSDKKPLTPDEVIPPSTTLEDINKRTNILKKYLIPKSCRMKLEQEIFKLGIHEGTLFPEIDRQAGYIKQLW